MPEAKRFNPNELFDFALACMIATGTPEAGSRIVGHHLVQNNLYGHDSHGVIRLPQYRDAIGDDYAVPTAEIEIVRERSTTAVIDGHKIWGQIAGHGAMDLAIDKARKHAVSAVSLRNCYHIGRVGAYVEKAAQKGFVAQIFCGCPGGSCVAPWGGTEGRLSTHPIAVGIPTSAEPVVVDMTTSTVAEGKIRVARNSGRSLPLGFILDRDGKDSTNPADLYDGGTLLPLGGTLLGHKGYALGVVVELLGGILSGGGAAFPKGYRGNAAFIQVVDPTAFTDRDEFYSQCDEAFENIRTSQRKEGVDQIFLPGEIERQREADRRRNGIEIDAGTLAVLNEMAADLGIDQL